MLGIAESPARGDHADGPNTTDAAAIDYREDWGSTAHYVVDPHVKVMKNGAVVTEPASVRVAGLIAKSDNDRGFWWSPRTMSSTASSAATVRWISRHDPNARANLA